VVLKGEFLKLWWNLRICEVCNILCIDCPDGICGWNINISSEIEMTCDWFWQWIGREWNMCPLYWYIWCNWYVEVLSHIQHLKYLTKVWNGDYSLQRSEFCEWILAIEWYPSHNCWDHSFKKNTYLEFILFYFSFHGWYCGQCHQGGSCN